MKRILIAAHQFRHAEYYAREVLHLPKSGWNFVNSYQQIQGQRGAKLLLIKAPRYEPTRWEREMRAVLLEYCLALEIKIEQVVLP